MTHLTRRHFNRNTFGRSPHIARAHLNPQPQPLRRLTHERFVPIALTAAKLVIEMRDDRAPFCPRQQIEQNHRIDPARNGGDHGLSRRGHTAHGLRESILQSWHAINEAPHAPLRNLKLEISGVRARTKPRAHKPWRFAPLFMRLATGWLEIAHCGGNSARIIEPKHMKPYYCIAALTLAACASQAASGLAWIDSNTNLTFTADLRLRYELDWNSHTPARTLRDDRHRGRIRARLGANYSFNEKWSAGVRVRTGDSRSQQSPHLTFVVDEGADVPRDEIDFVVDKHFVQYKDGPLTAWAGRNSLPFWQQTELFWDEDVTPTGLAGLYDFDVAGGRLTAGAGAFFLPDGGYDLHGQMLAAHAKHVLPVDRSTLTTGAGAFYLNGEENPTNLPVVTGTRDYLIGTFGAQWSMPLGKFPLGLGGDIYRNFREYDVAAEDDERLGWVLSATYGQLKASRDWLVGYYYARIEAFSVNGSYAQDDWHRFGAGPQTMASDFKGHEIRLAYAISKNINVVARGYFVEAITTAQDNQRVRVDLNWRY